MKKLVGYITTSLPSNNFTVDLAYSLKIVELIFWSWVFLFQIQLLKSPIIEKANLLALKNGFKINNLFEVSSKIAKDIDTFMDGIYEPILSLWFRKLFKKQEELNFWFSNSRFTI